MKEEEGTGRKRVKLDNQLVSIILNHPELHGAVDLNSQAPSSST